MINAFTTHELFVITEMKKQNGYRFERCGYYHFGGAKDPHSKSGLLFEVIFNVKVSY